MKLLSCIVLVGVLMVSCKKNDSTSSNTIIPVDSTQFYPKKVVSLDTGVSYNGLDSSIELFTYNKYYQLAAYSQVMTRYDTSGRSSVDTYAYTFQFGDTLNSMPTTYTFTASFKGSGTLSNEQHFLKYQSGQLRIDSVISNIPTATVFNRFYTYGNNAVVKTTNTPSKEGDSTYINNQLVTNYAYLNGTLAVSQTVYTYGTNSPNNPMNLVKALWIMGNHINKSTKLPASYTYQPIGGSKGTGTYTYKVDAMGRVTNIGHTSFRENGATRISY